jgi:biopolymer transport protein ExbB
MDAIPTLFEQALEIWQAGGQAMVAIAVVAFVMFWLGADLWARLVARRHSAVPETTWRRWIDEPGEREGRIGALLDTAMAAQSCRDVPAIFAGVRAAEVAPLARDLKVMRICVSAAPLVGLLGTVIGMLATFGALASGAGGDKTMAMVADGISEALITTETGLVVAIPGLFFQYQLTRRFEGYKAFLAHLETVVTQTLFRREQTSRTAA